jgi:hypothetical protein
MTAKKAFPQKSFPATVTFRPDQFAIVRRLQDQRKLSTVCQKAVDLDTELEDLPDGVRDDAMEAAAASLFDEWSLSGSYAISQDGGGVRHEATADEMALDAKALGILSGNLILALQELFDLEKEYALRKAAVLRKYRRKK